MAYLYHVQPGTPQGNPQKFEYEKKELMEMFRGREFNFNGPTLPVFEAEKGRPDPQEKPKYVVVQINNEETDDKTFPHAGYYTVAGVIPA